MRISVPCVCGRKKLPEVKDRKSYGFTASPDATQVAFLSYLETDPFASLFVVPIEGGEPTKVPNQSFEKDMNPLLDWI